MIEVILAVKTEMLVRLFAHPACATIFNLMRSLVTFILCILSLVGSSAATDQRQKLAEGKYAKSVGDEIEQSSQEWTLWRSADGGYELEDHFEVANPAAALVAELQQKAPRRVSPELVEGVRKEVAQTELHLTFSCDWHAQALLVKGRRLIDNSAIVLADCQITDSETHCKGANGNAKLKGRDMREFLIEGHWRACSI
jgi:hypothetical protein